MVVEQIMQDTKFKIIIQWVNSCVTYEQLDNMIEYARKHYQNSKDKYLLISMHISHCKEILSRHD